jgi:hypothetical protein
MACPCRRPFALDQSYECRKIAVLSQATIVARNIFSGDLLCQVVVEQHQIEDFLSSGVKACRRIGHRDDLTAKLLQQDLSPCKISGWSSRQRTRGRIVSIAISARAELRSSILLFAISSEENCAHFQRFPDKFAGGRGDFCAHKVKPGQPEVLPSLQDFYGKSRPYECIQSRLERPGLLEP